MKRTTHSHEQFYAGNRQFERALRQATKAVQAYTQAYEAAKWRQWMDYWLKVAGIGVGNNEVKH